MSWGIADTAPEIEKIKAESADYLHGLDSCGVIDWDTYNYAFDFYMDLLNKAYEQGKKDASSEWIPVSERLPKENGQYLITVKYEHVDGYEDIYAEHGEWLDGKWDMFCFGHCGEVEDIIAWMTLPEPYTERR